MSEKYLELRNRSSFGDIINIYFLFLKHNFKIYTNLYLRYNAISVILTLICSYLLVTGFMGLASRDFRFGMSNNVETEGYFIAGIIILFLIVFVTSLINYSFSSAYIADYIGNKGKIESKRIWKRIANNIGTIILFIIIGGIAYVIYIIIATIFSFIPLLGMIIQYGLSFTISAIFGLTFMSIFSEQKGFRKAISEGFEFTFFKFWKVILFGLTIGILNLLVTALIISIPSIIMGIYVYFSVQSNVEIATSTFSILLFTFGFAVFLLTFIYTQALTQLAYGMLYYNLHETKYNHYLRQKIDQIGISE